MRILLVENHPDTLAYLLRYLRRAGHEVTTATTVAEAVMALAAASQDVMLTDISLPDGDGWALLERLGKERPRIAIAMSGRYSPEDRARSAKAGFQEHLGKPFGPDELDRVLRTLSQT